MMRWWMRRKDLIDLALRELIRTSKKRNLLDLSGQIQFAPDYDHKALRENCQNYYSIH
jgi:hypothetical protein